MILAIELFGVSCSSFVIVRGSTYNEYKDSSGHITTIAYKETLSTIDQYSQTILTYPTYFARQGIQSISISSRSWIKKQETVQIYLANRQDMKTNREKENKLTTGNETWIYSTLHVQKGKRQKDRRRESEGY